MTRSEVTGPPKALSEIMSLISEDHWSAQWLHNLEWFLWADLQAWRRGEPTLHLRDGDGAEWLPALDVVQKAVGGWVWWVDGPEFVPDERWAELVAARASWLFPPDDNREVLERATATPEFRRAVRKVADAVEEMADQELGPQS